MGESEDNAVRLIGCNNLAPGLWRQHRNVRCGKAQAPLRCLNRETSCKNLEAMSTIPRIRW